MLFLLLGDILDGPLEPLHILGPVAIHEGVEGRTLLSFALFVHPGKLLRLDVIGPQTHVTRLQDERQAVITLPHSLGQTSLPNPIEDVIEQQDDGDDGEGGGQMPHPCRDTRITAVGIKPLVLDGLQLVSRSQRHIGTVDTFQQMVVARHELILAIRHVDRHQCQFVSLVFPHEPFQRHRVPEDDTVVLVDDLMEGALHIVIGHDLLRPGLFHEVVMTETAAMHDDAVVLQVFLLTDMDGFVLGGQDTMRKQLHDVLAVETVLTGVFRIHTQHQVALPVLQVCLGLQGGLQFDDIGDVEFLEDQFQEVDVIAVGLAVLIQEHVGPQVPGILIDQRMRRRVGPGCICQGRLGNRCLP